MYSVSDGFKNGVNPNIIKHPANCEIVKHIDNQKKNSKSNITLNELLEKIEQWDERK
jgi:hypothetical protein